MRCGRLAGLLLLTLVVSAAATSTRAGVSAAATSTRAGVSAAATGTRAGAVSHVDGISDQDLPQWDGSFASSPFAGYFRSVLVPAQISWARYVVQWNATAETSNGPSPDGDYREQFEAWLSDVRGAGLKPLLGLTSYTGVYPSSVAEYQRRLQALLDLARSDGEAIGSLEPWNEPNSQGRLNATTAAELADDADSVCAADGCEVIAGDFADLSTLEPYEAAYIRALTFRPVAWGIHPYEAVLEHSDAGLVRFKLGLPDGGSGAQIWFTEVGAYYCLRGTVRGQARQLSDASYLTDTLIHDSAIAPVHVFYYGFLAGDRAPAKCSPDGGADTELYNSHDEARLAARAILVNADAARIRPERSVLAVDGDSESVSFLTDRWWWMATFNGTAAAPGG